MTRRDGTPLWISNSTATAEPLRRADLRLSINGQNYDEAWLQRLLHEHPAVLPVEQIEPGFGQLVPLCRELTLTFGGGRTGALDNLFVTAEGRLVIVEAKLWRNPEARRTVVAQAIEYAAAIFRLSYEELQSGVLRARAKAPETFQAKSVYELVATNASGVNEAEFVDAVSRNLQRGRAIITVVGDGIREDLAPLAELLQTHAGHRFTFALVELAVYDAPQSGIRVVAPSVLAQTALIERGVVQIQDSADSGPRIVVRDPPITTAHTSSRERAFGIGEDEFYEILDQRVSGASTWIKGLLARAETLGVYADRQGGLNLKHAAPNGNALNLATIDKYGFVDTSPSTWWTRAIPGRHYNDAVALLIGGVVREMKDGQSAVRTANGKMPKISDLLPIHEQQWLAAMEQYIRELFEAADES